MEETLKRVPVEPFRIAMQRRGLTATHVAKALGWYRSDRDWNPRADESRVNRALGIVGYRNGNGRMILNKTITYERGVEFAYALGVDPVEVGV